MGLPEKRREADELVEPLFAGLAGAEEEQSSAQPEGEAAGAKLDPWTNSRAALAPTFAPPRDPDAEPSLAPLLLKALALVIALIAIGAFVYFSFGV